MQNCWQTNYFCFYTVCSYFMKRQSLIPFKLLYSESWFSESALGNYIKFAHFNPTVSKSSAIRVLASQLGAVQRHKFHSRRKLQIAAARHSLSQADCIGVFVCVCKEVPRVRYLFLLSGMQAQFAECGAIRRACYGGISIHI